MKRKHLLILMLLALMMPLAVNAQSSLPFSENFNLVPVNQLPTDWVLSSTQVGTVTAVVQKETPTSTNRLLLMAVTQLKNGNGALAVQIPGNAIGKRYVKLTFKLMPTNANSGTFKVVCASTSFTNPIEVATYNASDLTVGDWNYITTPVTLSSSKTITFMVTTTTADTGWAIDDVSVTDGYKPTNVTTSVLEPNYATISWDYSGTSGYEMQYRMQGETDWTTVTTSSNHYAISGLLPNHTYEAQVRGYQGTYYTGWNEITFTTPDANYDFAIVIPNSNRYLYYQVIDSYNHVKVVPPFNSFSDPWGTFAKPEGNVTIPETVTYGGVTYTVTAIGSYALLGCTGVTGLSLPSTVTTIGNYAFGNCKLTSLTIPSSVTNIDQYAFYQCGGNNGMTVNIEGNTTTGTTIQSMAFYKSKVNELTLGEGVTTVGDKAFWGCSLLTTLHFNATNCTQMQSTYNSAIYSVFNSGTDNTTHPAITTLTIGNNVTNIPNYAFYDFTSLSEVTISEGVSSIGNQAFWNCPNLATVNFNATNCTNMKTTLNSVSYSSFNSGSDNTTNPAVTTLNIGNNVTNIPDYAFYGFTSLPEVTISEGVTSIGERAFWKCPNLTTVHFNATNCTNMKTTYYYVSRSPFNSGTDNTTNPAIITLTIGSNVTRIPPYAFYGADQITTGLIIPSSVQYIEECAFKSCSHITVLGFAEGSQLESIGQEAFSFCDDTSRTLTLPNSLTEIGYGAFYYCGFWKVIIPSSVTSIGANAFHSCGSNNMIVEIAGNPTSGTTIGNYAFYNSDIAELTIGEGVTSIGEQAFWKCPNLTTVHFNAINCTNMMTTYNNGTSNLSLSPFNSGDDENSYPAITTLTIGSNVTRIPAYAFYGANQISSNLTIPSSVQYIEESAFAYCKKISGLSFAEDAQLVSIGTSAFYYCENIKGTLRFPNSLTEIGGWAFCLSGLLSKIIIPSSVTSIGTSAFNSCNRDGYQVGYRLIVEIAGNPTSGTTIGNDAFRNSDIVELTIGDGVTSIGNGTFWKCQYLTTVHFNAVNCTNMMTTYNNGTSDLSLSPFNSGDDENSYPAITTLTIGDNVTRIPKYAFYHANSISNNLIIPSSVQYIEESAFAYCKKISGLSFAEDAQLVSIGTSAFYYCERIKGTLRFPNSLTEIGGWAFCLSGLLSKIIIPSSVTSIGTSAFNSCNRDSYQGGYRLIVEIAGNPTSGTTIGNDAFRNSDIVELTIGDGVTSIGNGAFWKCQYLTTVHFNAVNCTHMSTAYTDGSITYHYSPFNSGVDNTTDPAITTLTIGSNVTRIPAYAFYGANQISSNLTIPSSVQYIEEYAFKFCSSIPNISFAEGSQLESIGEQAFYYCDDMSGNLWLPNSLTEIGYRAFYHCGFWKVVIPSSVTSIAAAAFHSCGSDMVVEIAGNPTSGTTIGNYAFNSSDIKELTIGECVTSIGEQAFWNCPNLTKVHFNAINCTHMSTTYTDGDNTYHRSVFNSGEDLTTGPVITVLTLGENVTYIPEYAFYDCQTAPVKLNIPNVTAVGDGAFYNCMLATDLNLGNSVVTIGMKAFENCSNITGDLIIPHATTFIGASAFCDAGLNGALALGQNVNSLGSAAFKNCNFTSIVIGKGNSSEPNNITTAEANTFEGVRNYIPVYRPYGTNYPTATGWNHFTNYLTEYQLNGGAWSVASNWSQNNVPGADDVVLINGNSHISSNTSPTVKSLYIANGDAKTLKIYDGAMLTVTDGIYNTDPSKLIVNDGGQLITPKVTAATVERKTSASEAKTYNNWYAIASPVNEESIEDFVKGTHNVYRYNEPTIMWQEYRVPVNQFSKLTNGQGYLYRSTEANIALDGDINVGDVKVWLSKECSNIRYQGFNLIGNPYPHNIYKGASNAAIPNGDLLEDKYCVLGVNGNWILTDDGTAIKPGTAILVQAKESGNLTMHDVTTGGTAKRAENDKIWFTVSDNDYEDVVCVEFREGRGFNKMAHYNEDAPMLYINYNGEDFASIDMNENIHIIDLCFKAKTMGQYTLRLNANGNISYLHLIDRLTGNDVDMLVEDEYSFIGMAGDNANRFIVKLNANGDSSDDNFIYQNGDDIVVSGEGELQVFDVMGRMVASQRVNGVETLRKPDLTGVYIYKMNEKTQKIVVR